MEGNGGVSARAVLFGTNGQLGARLLSALEAAGYEVTGIDRARCDFASVTAKELAVIIRAVEPVLVINAVAYTAVDQAESEPELAMRINGEVPEMIAAACAEQQVPLMHFSTDYVFDGLGGAPFREDAPTHPLGVYAKSKLAGEQAVAAQGGYVFRLQWVYDVRGKNFFLTMRRLLAEREEVRVVADQLGAPSYAPHIANVLMDVMPKMLNQTLPPGIYHLAAAGHTSWHGFACTIAQSMGVATRVVPIVSAEYPTPAQRPKDGRLDCSTLASYGIAMPHWREGLAQAASSV